MNRIKKIVGASMEVLGILVSIVAVILLVHMNTGLPAMRLYCWTLGGWAVAMIGERVVRNASR